MTTFSNLQPYQQEFLDKIMARTTVTKRFQVVPGLTPYSLKNTSVGSYSILIEDYIWWMDNEREILNWMVDHLPEGIDHQQGMVIFFPTDEDRVVFLLKWGG